MAEANFYKTHADFVALFARLKDAPVESTEEISNEIIRAVKEEADNEKMIAYALKRLYTGLSATTKLSRRGFTITLLQLLRAFPKLQESVYPDVMKFTKPDSKVSDRNRKTYFIGRVFGYNILLRLGLISKVKEEVLLKIVGGLIKLSKKSTYIADISLKTLCQIFDETKVPAIADLIFRDLPSDATYWSPFHIGAACHLMCADHAAYRKRMKKRVTDASGLIETLFARQLESRGETALFAWTPLVRYGMMNKAVKWDEFWKDMVYLLSRPIHKRGFTYYVYTTVIAALPGNSHRVQDVIGFKFCRLFVIWVKQKVDITKLRLVFVDLVKTQNARFLFQLAAALLGIKDFDKRIGAPIFETLMAKPEAKEFNFEAMTEKLVQKYTEVRRPFVEATEEEEKEIDEVVVEAKCRVVFENIHRLSVARAFTATANPDWWVAGAKFFLQKSCFHSEAKRDKLAFALQPDLSSRGISIIAAHINLNGHWFKDDEWKIDRVFELVDTKAMFKEYGPKLLNNANPKADFKRAKKLSKKLVTMELTTIQRRVFEVVVKTCRLLLITELYGGCSQVLELMMEEDKDLQDMMFGVVLSLMENRSKLLKDLGTLVWKIFAKTAPRKHLDALLELASPNEREEEREARGDKEEEGGEPRGKPKGTGQENDEQKGKPKETEQEEKNEEAAEEKPDKEPGPLEDKADGLLENKADGLLENNADELVENKADAEKLLKPPSEDDEEEEQDGGLTAEEIDAETNMMKQIVMAILQKKQDGRRINEIDRTMLPKICRLLEIFAETRVGDPLILTMVCPLLERYNQDPEKFAMAKRILKRMAQKKKEKDLPIEGVDMETMQAIIQDCIHVLKSSKSKSILDFMHSNVLIWLFKLYFRIARREEKTADAEKWVQEHYKDFWTGLITRVTRYKFFSLPVFKCAVIRFPMLAGPLLGHIFESVKEGKISRPFNQFQTLCFISYSGLLRENAIVTAFKACHVEYAKAFCKLLPGLKKNMHIKEVTLNFIKFARNLSAEEKSALLKGSDLETMLSEFPGDRASRLLTMLKT